MSFSTFRSFQKLSALSKKLIDLPSELTSQRIEKMVLKALGFTFFYGTERVTQEVMEALYLLAEEANALSWMQKMQDGEVINQIEGYESEKRAVLHTAMRDLFSHRNLNKAAFEASQKAEKEVEKLEQFLKKYSDRFEHIVQVGIGGSDLGPRAVCLALKPFYRKNITPHFISNVDPDDATDVLSSLDLKKTLVVVVSKSGSTLETLTNEEFCRSYFVKKGIDPKEHFVAVTGEKSPMDDPQRYLASFYMWDYVGGRYSATSMVGGVILGFCLGIEGFREILKGAHDMDHHAKTAPIRENLPLHAALLGIWNRNFLHLPTVAVIPYSQALLRFPAHLQQLDMESNGKRIDRLGRACDFSTGPVVWGEPGTNGQHSFYQLIHQGTDPTPLEFIGFQESQYGQDLEIQKSTSQEKLLANLFAQTIALAVGQKSDNPNRYFPGNRPSSLLIGKKLDPYAMGALLSYYENKVAFQGFIWGINSFDQEGVQLGKLLATRILSHFQEKRGGKKAEKFELAESYLKFFC